jgi:integrase
MIQDCETVNAYYKEQKKSQKEEDNWVSTDEIKKLYDDLFTNASAMLNNKIAMNYQTIVQYMLLASLGGVSGIAPRRSLDFTDLKLKNYSKTDNYYKGGKFYFNIYKTSQHYGEQVIDVKEKAPEFYKLLQKWCKINPTDYLLFSSNQEKFTSPQVTKAFNKLFGKRASTNMLRHSYLTDKYGKLQEEMAEDSVMMSHSPATQALYIKK